MLRYAGAGHVVPLSEPVNVGRSDAVAPCAFNVARQDAIDGAKWISNLQHRVSAPPRDVRTLLTLLDGRTSRESLLGHFTDGTGSPTSRLNEALRIMEREALLWP